MDRIKMLNEMLEKRPEDAFLYHALGMEHLGRQDVELAIEFFVKAIEFQQDFIASYYKITECYMTKENWEIAKQYGTKGYSLAEQKQDGKAMFEFEDLLDVIDEHFEE